MDNNRSRIREKNMLKIQVLVVLLFTACSSIEYNGKVVRVVDGDTIHLLDENNNTLKIRLNGIDAPEKGQDYYKKSGDYLSFLLAGKNVRVIQTGKDRYKRILGVVTIDDINVNEEMVRAGYAWRYKYSNNKTLKMLEDEARLAKRGLWNIPNAISPWEFRKNKKQKSQNMTKQPLVTPSNKSR